jgi:hypothetical protein
LGTFVLTPLEKQPEAFDLSNIGFEEKITQTTGDHLHAVFASDTSFALSWVRLPGEYVYDLVRTDLRTGEEEVLIENENISGSDYSLGTQLALFSDRFAIYEAARTDEQEPEYSTYHVVIYDLLRRTSLVVPNTLGDRVYHATANQYNVRVFLWWGAWSFTDSTFYYLQQFGDAVELSQYGGGQYCLLCGRKMEFCAFSAETGERRCTALHPFDEYTTFDAWAMTPSSVVFQISATHEDQWGGLTSRTGGPLFQIPLSSMQRRILTPDMTILDFMPTADGSVIFATTPGYPNSGSYSTLVQIETLTGSLHEVWTAPENTYSLFAPTASPDGTVVAMPKISSSYPTAGGVAVDLASGTTVRAWDGTGSYRDQTLEGFDFCGWSFGSSPAAIATLRGCYSDDGSEILLYRNIYQDEYQELFGENRSVLLVQHLPLDGSPATVEELDPALDPRYSDTPPRVPSPDARLEAQVLRVEETGFSQLFVRPLGTTDWTQVSFINAQHLTPVWSPDTAALVYLTRDPVSGYSQFFRVFPDSFLNPEEHLKE